MGAFYGTIQGNRGVASRIGSGKSGIRAMIKSWRNTINCWLYEDENGVDRLNISTEKLGSNSKLKIFIDGKEYKRR